MFVNASLRLLGVAATLGAAAVAVAAGDPTPPASASHGTSHTASTPRNGDRIAHVVAITARDYAFDAPDTIAAGRTELQLFNRGTELHHAYLLRLDGNRTLGDLLNAFRAGGPPPAWVHDAGGPNAPVPNGSSVAVVDFVPGTYALICVIPGADGVPHVMKGMAHTFTVVAAPSVRGERSVASSATVTRAPDATITLSDYAFAVSRPLGHGHHVIRVRNTAAQSHEVFIARLADGKTPEDVIKWVEKPQGESPLFPIGGTVSLEHGATNDIAVDLTPGRYAFFCFVPDAKDGKPHVMHGMVQPFTVQ